MTMRYIAIVHKGEDSAYGVTLPDFPGVFSGADDWESLAGNIQEAVELWAEGQDFEPPEPSSFEAAAQSEAARDGMLMLVDIDFSFLDAKVVPVNITMPVYVRNRIDRAAKAVGMNRSRFIVEAAQRYARAGE
jgi:predicted RNase H-like HicB family nuclease